MPEQLQRETEQVRKRVEEDGGQEQAKSESKAGRIIRLTLAWVFGLAFLAFIIMLVVKKCSGQI